MHPTPPTALPALPTRARLPLVCLLFGTGLSLGAQTVTDRASPPPVLPPAGFLNVDLFPGLDQHAPTEIVLAGLAALYPGRIVRAAETPAVGEPTTPLIRDFGTGRVLIRAGTAADAATALSQRSQTPIVLLDLRRADSDAAGALALGAALNQGAELELEVRGAFPQLAGARIPAAPAGPKRLRFVLTGPVTRGPQEVILDLLARRGDIITIGSTTSGATGALVDVPGFPEWRMLAGEVLSAQGASLFGTGTLPVISVPHPEDDAAAWDALQAGATLEEVTTSASGKRRFGEAELIRAHTEGKSLSEAAGTQERTTREPARPIDLTLQRAVGIVNALEALGRLPEGAGAAAARVSVPSAAP